MKNTKKVAKPFGLELLTEVELKDVNGGVAKKPGGPVFVTQAISMPTKHHHGYDHF